MSPRYFSVGKVEKDEDRAGKVITKAELVFSKTMVVPPISNRQISNIFPAVGSC